MIVVSNGMVLAANNNVFGYSRLYVQDLFGTQTLWKNAMGFALLMYCLCLNTSEANIFFDLTEISIHYSTRFTLFDSEVFLESFLNLCHRSLFDSPELIQNHFWCNF